MALLYFAAAWIAGIFFAASTDTAPVEWLGLAAGTAVLAFAARRAAAWRMTFLCILLCALGAGRYAQVDAPLPSSHIAHFADTGYVTLTGIIVQDADIRDTHTNLRIAVDTLSTNRTTVQVRGMVLAQASIFGSYRYGDRVRVSGTLLTPPEFDDFSYRDYLARQHIHAMVPNAEVVVLAHGQGNSVYAALYAVKARAQVTIDRLLPSPQAPLLSGILLGVESGISADIREAFNETGTAHIIAISGANIIVVIRVLMGFLARFLSNRNASLVTIVGVGMYTVFVGADAAVVRAAIMGTVTIIAIQVGRQAYSRRARQTYALNALALSAWLMTLHNPYTLWDVGFQLSVAATAGLILFGDLFTQAFERALQRGFARETARSVTQILSEPFTVSLAAQITTTPLILLYFGRFSTVSLLANVLIVSVQPYIMTLGGLATIVGTVWILPGQIIAWTAWLPLTYTLEIVRALGTLDFASFEVAVTPSDAWLMYSLLLIPALLVRLHSEDRAALIQLLRRHITTTTLLLMGTAITVLVWLAAWSQPDNKLHIWFLNVGQGHAVLIQTPRGAQILVDGGPNLTRLRSALGDALPFRDRSLDLMIVTQSRNSTISALPALLNYYNVETALYNGHDAETAAIDALRDAWAAHSVDVVNVIAGYALETDDGVRLEFLSPLTAPEPDDNADQMAAILRVSYGNTAFLLTPTLNETAIETLLDAGWYIESTVLELPSHGNRAVNTDRFLAAVRPQIGVVGVAAGNRSGLPHQETIERLRTVTEQTLLRTDKHGTIEMITDGQRLWVYPER